MQYEWTTCAMRHSFSLHGHPGKMPGPRGPHGLPGKMPGPQGTHCLRPEARSYVARSSWPQRPCNANGQPVPCAIPSHSMDIRARCPVHAAPMGSRARMPGPQGTHCLRPEARSYVARSSWPQRPCNANATCAMRHSFSLHGHPGKMPGPRGPHGPPGKDARSTGHPLPAAGGTQLRGVAAAALDCQPAASGLTGSPTRNPR